MNEYDPLRVELRQELQAATRAADREVAHLARRRRCNAGRSELVVRPEGAVEEQEIGSTGHASPNSAVTPAGAYTGSRSALSRSNRRPRVWSISPSVRTTARRGVAREPDGGQSER